MPASATLSAGCVSPRGAQTLHIRSTAGLSVSFDTQYSDSNEGRMYGGEGTGVIGPDGTFQSTWTEAANAPLGQAVVYVAVAGGQMTAFRQATFNVASRC